MFDVKPGDKSQEFPTRGPRPAGGYRFFCDSSRINTIIQVSAEVAAEAVVVVDVAVATFAADAAALAVVVAVAVAGNTPREKECKYLNNPSTVLVTPLLV